MGDIATKPLGHTNVVLPEIGLGTWNYNGGPAPLRKGLEAGALFIDTAESYGNEAVVGEAVRGIRNSVFLATKVSPQNFRREALKQSAEHSLQKLKTDRIDLLQLHAPNPEIAIEETMGAMVELVEAGKVRFIGVSNFSNDQIEKAQNVLGCHRIVSNQVRYSLIDRTIEAGLLQYCQANRISVIAYSPLGREFARVFDCDPGGVIAHISSLIGKTQAQVVLNWCLCKQGVVAIPKGNSEAHILENCGASGWRLSPEHLALLDSQIQFRQRSRFDKLVREWMPGPLRAIAVRLVGALPRGMRRRVQ